MSKKQEPVHKVTLSSGKIVFLRDPKIKHQELAVRAVGNKASNQIETALLMQKELVKILVVQINEKAPTPQELEDLDALFSIAEYMQVNQVISQLMGGADAGNFQVEFGISG